MAKKKLAMVQDIPGMKIYDGPNGPEMYATDKRGGWPHLYWEAKRICHKVRITYIEPPRVRTANLDHSSLQTGEFRGWMGGGRFAFRRCRVGASEK